MTRCVACGRLIWPWARIGWYVLASGKRAMWHAPRCRAAVDRLVDPDRRQAMTTPDSGSPRTSAEQRYYALYDATGGDFPTMDQYLAFEAEAAAPEPLVRDRTLRGAASHVIQAWFRDSASPPDGPLHLAVAELNAALAQDELDPAAGGPDETGDVLAAAWQQGYEDCWNRLNDAGRLLPSVEEKEAERNDRT